MPLITLSACALSPIWISGYNSYIAHNKEHAEFTPLQKCVAEVTEDVAILHFAHREGRHTGRIINVFTTRLKQCYKV